MRLPITVQQAPTFARQVAQRSQVLRRPLARQPVFRLCYFSCHSYFAYLYCALHSVVRAAAAQRIDVIVFSDTDQPLSEAQTAALVQLVPGLRVVPWPKSMGWGAEQIGWIWRAYALAAEGAHDDDIVARVDSDVFFFNDRIFSAVARSGADMVGDGHFVDFKYCQGGVYFLRAEAVRRVNTWLADRPLAPLLDAAGIDVEDVAATHFVRTLGLKLWMTWFMMFPDELRNAGGLNRWQRWKFSCLHFVMKNKAGMVTAYAQEVLPAAERPAFHAALTVV